MRVRTLVATLASVGLAWAPAAAQEVDAFRELENRFFPREVELSLFGQVDPYAYAEVRIETGEETRGEDLTVKLAEAAVTLLSLPLGTQAKFGQMRNRFGYSNMIHEHDLP